jgi:predicted glycoside hydrolase/deacetylase ChbG (UPF0249 family)
MQGFEWRYDMFEFHADDYGLFPEQSCRILDCIENGVINGVSIMPNSPYLKECMEFLSGKDVKLTVHLNLVEGAPLTAGACEHISGDGAFNVSFGKLLIVSYIPFLRKKYYEEIKRELGEQIKAVAPYFKDGYRLDSHVHYHMLPVVFDALADVIRENGIKVTYIRVPSEDLKLYKGIKLRPINRVKVMVLNTLARRNRRKYKELFDKFENKKFSGVACSGEMNYENVKTLISRIDASEDFEILFHPGAVLEDEDIAGLTSKDDLAFLTSENRHVEEMATKMLKDNKDVEI